MPHIIRLEIDQQALKDDAVELGWESEDSAVKSMVYSKFRAFDTNYLRPYYLRKGNKLLLHGYSQVDPDTLRGVIASNRPSHEPRCFRWDTLESKPFPVEKIVKDGMLLRFETKFCPTVPRIYYHGDKITGESPAGAIRHGDGIGIMSHESATEWLRSQLEFVRPNGSPPVRRCELVDLPNLVLHVDQVPLQFKRHQQPQSFPSVVAQGVLRVVEPTLFCNVITRGIGHHLTYGFGMVLVSRAE